PELGQDMAASHADRLRHEAPTADLLVGVDAGRRNIALPLGRDLRGLGDDQPRARALSIVEGIERGWDVAFAGAAARQGRHYDPVVEMQGSELDGGKDIRTRLRL